MRRDDLALFEILQSTACDVVPGAGAAQRPQVGYTIAHANTWALACERFWTQPRPRAIVATAPASATGLWLFRVEAGTGLRIAQTDVAQPPLRYILRYVDDASTLGGHLSVTPATLQWRAASPPLPGPTSPFECMLVSAARNIGADTGMIYLGPSAAASRVIALNDLVERPVFAVRPNGGVSRIGAELPMKGTNLTSAGESVNARSAGTCRVAVGPSPSGPVWTWGWDDVAANDVAVHRLDGDRALMADHASGWNLHAYGWMMQSAEN